MKKTIITFNILSFEEGMPVVGNSDSHQRQFEFQGTFEEAKTFLDEVMTQRIEVQKTEANGKLPY